MGKEEAPSNVARQLADVDDDIRDQNGNQQNWHWNFDHEHVKVGERLMCNIPRIDPIFGALGTFSPPSYPELQSMIHRSSHHYQLRIEQILSLNECDSAHQSLH